MRQPPVPITDVVRAALGEVEDYQQVDARDVEPTTMLGVVAADLAHLIAELVENALVFSPEHQPVAVHGRTWPAGGTARPSDAGGHGHAPDAIEAANRRLAGVESFTVAPSMYLGHYVAGRRATASMCT